MHRAAQVTLQANSGDDNALSQLSFLAQCAGFDMVRFPSNTSASYIEVYVSMQRSYLPQYVAYPKLSFVEIDKPLYRELEYSLPDELLKSDEEYTLPILLDGYGDLGELPLTDYHLVKEFLSSGHR